ncbi:MAG TPA: hypothetical protein VN667_14550 [Burkholderiales bacterium]|nr:hypothetical protein [Burkholderiales bacterium]
MKTSLALTAIVICWCLVSHLDYQDALQQEREIIARIQAHCVVRGKQATKDRDGRWACTDSAPTWAMTSPIQPTKGDKW